MSGANLSYADLAGAELSGAKMTLAAFLATRMPDGSVQTDDPDALLLALKDSVQLLPSEALYLKYRKDLAAIRSAYPEVATVHCYPAWAPGQLVTTLGLSTANIQQLNQSEFGPVTVSYLGFSNFLIVLTKPYNPIVLARILESRFGIWSEPNYVGGDGFGITVDDSNARYTFYRGWGDCPMGCGSRHYWDFRCDDDGPRLIRQYGDPLPASPPP